MCTHAKYVCPVCNKPTRISTRAEMDAVFDSDGLVNEAETDVASLDPCGPEYPATCLQCGHEADLSNFDRGPCSACGGMTIYESGMFNAANQVICSDCRRKLTADDGPLFECALCYAILPGKLMHADTNLCTNCVLKFDQAMFDFCHSFGYSYMPLRVDSELTGDEIPYAAIIAAANPFVVAAQFALWLSGRTDLNVHRLLAHYGAHVIHTVDGRDNVLNFINCNPPD